MIVVTGAAGFIGSCLVWKLNQEGRQDLVLVDDFSNADKNHNLTNKQFDQKVHRNDFKAWLEVHNDEIEAVYHIGARTDTTEFDKRIFDELNVQYSKDVWMLCSQYQIPMIYASSAATYGLGELGYKDDHDIIDRLKPLNPYGDSKNEFDQWVMQQSERPPFWAGLKFFNVYGPNEYHKGRMASVIFHAFNQIAANGKVKLFRSHREDYKDGEQLRDFVYVKDVCNVCTWLMNNRPESGLYNLGTGTARSFRALAEGTFHALDKEPVIEFIDTPLDIRDKYQYFTEADMQKLIDAGYSQPFYSLEEGIKDYVQEYLSSNTYC